MSGKFDFEKLKQDKNKLKLYGIGIIIILLLALLVVGLITGKDFLSGGSDSESTAATSVTSYDGEDEDEPETSEEDTTDSKIVTDSGEKTTSAKTTAKKTTVNKTTTKKTTTKKTTAAVTTTTTAAEVKEYHFRNKTYLNQHFEKHGSEFKKDFGYKTAAEYEKGASDVINNPNALHKVEKEDGDYVYYVEATNEFVVLSKDGCIRTYFRPSAGIDYYNRQ